MEREIIYLSLHCHHQNDDSCIKMGSDESHFNVSVGSDGQRHRTVSTNHNLFEEKGAEAVSNRGPSAYQPNVLPLGQTGSHLCGGSEAYFVHLVEPYPVSKRGPEKVLRVLPLAALNSPAIGCPEQSPMFRLVESQFSTSVM